MAMLWTNGDTWNDGQPLTKYELEQLGLLQQVVDRKGLKCPSALKVSVFSQDERDVVSEYEKTSTGSLLELYEHWYEHVEGDDLGSNEKQSEVTVGNCAATIGPSVTLTDLDLTVQDILERCTSRDDQNSKLATLFATLETPRCSLPKVGMSEKSQNEFKAEHSRLVDRFIKEIHDMSRLSVIITEATKLYDEYHAVFCHEKAETARLCGQPHSEILFPVFPVEGTE